PIRRRFEKALRSNGTGLEVLWPAASMPSDPARLQLSEVLDFRPDLGVIRLHEQRVVILSAAALGLLRQALIDTLGVETARRLLLRFGFADGYHDAVNLRDRSHWKTPLDGLRAGITLQTLEGIVHGKIVKLQWDDEEGVFEAELGWRDSYEAEQHVHHFGTGDEPVCWSLVGYVSGFASACLEREIYFKETACAGQGRPACAVTGRDAASWGDEAESLRFDYKGADLSREVERGRAAVRKQL